MRKAERKQYTRQNQWTKENMHHFGFVLPKEYENRIKEAAARNGESVSGFLKRITLKALEEAEAEAGD